MCYHLNGKLSISYKYFCQLLFYIGSLFKFVIAFGQQDRTLFSVFNYIIIMAYDKQTYMRLLMDYFR